MKKSRKAEVVILKKNKIWKLPDNIRSTVYISFVKENISQVKEKFFLNILFDYSRLLIVIEVNDIKQF